MNSRIHFLLTLSPSQVPLRYNLSSNSLYLHTLPMSKLHQQNRFFFVGPWPRHSCLQGQAFTRWMWDFSECVIVIVTDWDRVTHALGSAALSCITTFSIFFLFNRPFVYGPRSRVEKERILRRRATQRQLAWVAVVAVHVVCLALVLRTTQFFAQVILWRWVRGLVLSTMLSTGGGPCDEESKSSDRR